MFTKEILIKIDYLFWLSNEQENVVVVALKQILLIIVNE